MDFTPKSKRRRLIVKCEQDENAKIYTHDLQLYKEFPKGQIDLEDFRTFANERLKVLRLVEQVSAQGLPHDKFKSALEKSLKEENCRHYVKLLYGTGSSQGKDEESEKYIIDARKRDYISHFILRLAFGQSTEHQDWFLRYEQELFKWRFTSLNSKGIIDLMKINELDYKPITDEEKKEYHDQIRAASYEELDVNKTDIYKVPFEDVLDLVSQRKVFLRKGMVFLPLTEVKSLFATFFKDNLQRELKKVPEYMAHIGHDERLTSFLKFLPNSHAEMNKVVWSDEITPIELLDELSKTSYPLCMRIMHEQLRVEHKLMHLGRIVYMLFLKGIGVTFDDSTKFWRDEYYKGPDSQKFEKEHKCTIEYMYGKKGKRTNYTPYGCGKLIKQDISNGQYHGCPYKYMDAVSLKTRLNRYKLPETDTTEIVDFAKKGECYSACHKYFQTTNLREVVSVVRHPNTYFQESRKIHNETTSSSDMTSQNTENTQSTPGSQLFSQTEALNALKPKIEKSPAPKKVLTKITPLNIEELLNENDEDNWSDAE